MYYSAFLCAFLVGFSAATYYETCDSESGKVTSLSVTNCDSNPCILKSGTKPKITIGFDTLADVKAISVDIKGIIGGFPFPFPGPKQDGCVNSGLHCPLEKGKSYTYSNSIAVSPNYPKVSVVVQYVLKDENNKDIVCVKIPSEIQK